MRLSCFLIISLPLHFSYNQVAKSEVFDNRKGLISGVAVTAFLGSPKWFQNRFSTMIANVYSSLPDDWVIQFFYKKNKMGTEATMYRGIQRLVQRSMVVLTPIPESMGKVKKRDLLLSLWFWENIIAERVLMFGGNSVICLNSPLNVNNFSHFEYIGSPWREVRGQGGDGGFSLRNRSRMIQILKIRNQVAVSGPSSTTETKIISLKGQEDYIFVKSMELLGVNLPSRKETTSFAMSGNIAVGKPFGALGTMSGLNDTRRTKIMEYCPELKIFYPSLHSSSCFGATPDPILCFQYLCEHAGLKCRKDQSVTWMSSTAITKQSSLSKEITLSIRVNNH